MQVLLGVMWRRCEWAICSEQRPCSGQEGELEVNRGFAGSLRENVFDCVYYSHY